MTTTLSQSTFCMAKWTISELKPELLKNPQLENSLMLKDVNYLNPIQ